MECGLCLMLRVCYGWLLLSGRTRKEKQSKSKENQFKSKQKKGWGERDNKEKANERKRKSTKRNGVIGKRVGGLPSKLDEHPGLAKSATHIPVITPNITRQMKRVIFFTT